MKRKLTDLPYCKFIKKKLKLTIKIRFILLFVRLLLQKLLAEVKKIVYSQVQDKSQQIIENLQELLWKYMKI